MIPMDLELTFWHCWTGVVSDSARYPSNSPSRRCECTHYKNGKTHARLRFIFSFNFLLQRFLSCSWKFRWRCFRWITKGELIVLVVCLWMTGWQRYPCLISLLVSVPILWRRAFLCCRCQYYHSSHRTASFPSLVPPEATRLLPRFSKASCPRIKLDVSCWFFVAHRRDTLNPQIQ